MKLHQIVLLGIIFTYYIWNFFTTYGYFEGDDIEYINIAANFLFRGKLEGWKIRHPFYPLILFIPMKLAYILDLKDFYLLTFPRVLSTLS